jgi:nucleoside-diphosphate-sugar epimerase
VLREYWAENSEVRERNGTANSTAYGGNHDYDIRSLTRHAADFPSHVGDIADLEEILPAFRDIDVVVHLAAEPDVETPWDKILHSNIIGTRNVFEAARLNGVGTVVFASSNHTIGMYEEEAVPDIYALGDARVFDETAEMRPDSLYGVSKVFGEALGRYYSDKYGIRVLCVRIGTVRKDDDPCAPEVADSSPWLPLSGDEKYERLRATWLSHKDCAQLLSRCIEAEDVRWAVVYGISNNPRQFWDITAARQLLGYQPEDSAPADCR